MAKDYSALAQIIIDNVGGRDNVISLAHCVTRLRFSLRDESKVNDDVLSATPGVIKVLHVPGQTHVVVGQAVDLIYDAVLALGGVNAQGAVELAAEDAEMEQQRRRGILGAMIDVVSGIIAPTLGTLSAAGTLKGLLALWAFLDPGASELGAYQMFNAIGDGFFYFMPIILGYTAARKFNLDVFVGLCLGCALTYPSMVAFGSAEALGTLLGGTPFEMSFPTTFFGIPVIYPAAGYTSSVIPIIVACWVGSKIERRVKPMLPDFLRFFMSPLIVLCVTVPLTYLVIGPASALLTTALQFAFDLVRNIPAVGSTLLGALVGALWQVLVIFGFHWALVSLAMVNYSTIGYDYIVAVSWVCSFAQTAVCLAIFLRTRSPRLKETAVPAIFTGFFGVTEPAIYGVTLPRTRYFVISCLGSCVGAAVAGAASVHKYRMGGMSVFGLPSFIDSTGETAAASFGAMHSVVWILIGMAIAVAISFVLTILFYQDKGEDAEDAAKAKVAA